ncbi:MAG: ABC transporter substrate-binding protein [Ideonella sp.]|nr:ABC transporter substrate-binding protein [Ideonella sp.]
MTLLKLAASVAAMLAVPAFAQSQLTVVNFGGANANAQKKAYYEPFEKTGTKVVSVEYNGEQAKVKAMVEAKKVTWDVVELESPDVGRGCDEGLFEKLDYSKIGSKADFAPPAAVHECGIGIFVWSTVMAYNGDKLKEAPKTWADFWDTKKFAGKRAMRKGARYNVEFALMADGVKPEDVYKVLSTPAGADRAFKKLGELKANIQWWEAGAQPPQFLVAGDVVMATAYNGRIDAAAREGKNLKISWVNQIYDLEYYGIVKGTPNRDAAYKYLAFALGADAQAEYAKNIAYGPTNIKALSKLDAKTLGNLPTAAANMKGGLEFNIKFWADQGEALEKRFASWATQ